MAGCLLQLVAYLRLESTAAAHVHFKHSLLMMMEHIVMQKLSDKMLRFVFMVKTPSRILMHAIKGA